VKPEALARAVHRRLTNHFGAVKCPLHYSASHELCIAVILSAQCTDERVNLTTPALFKRFPTVQSYADADLSEIEALIHSTGFYRNKARHIQGFCRQILKEHNGSIPSDVDSLQRLPGVGRKTANVISQELFGQESGIVVDTHVMRLSRLLGLTRSKDPSRIEKDLMQVVPRKAWRDWSLLLIFLGRSNCRARVRLCGSCPLRTICPAVQISGAAE
jgi:endonuclease-3